MTTSGTEDDAMRLLLAFHELSGGKLNEPVPLGGPDSTEAEAAAPHAGMDPDSVDCETALRYLIDQNYIEQADEESGLHPHRTRRGPGQRDARRIKGSELTRARPGPAPPRTRRLRRSGRSSRKSRPPRRRGLSP